MVYGMKQIQAYVGTPGLQFSAVLLDVSLCAFTNVCLPCVKRTVATSVHLATLAVTRSWWACVVALMITILSHLHC